MTEWIELIGIRSWETIWIPVGIWTLPALAVLFMARARRIPVRIRLDVVLLTILALPVAVVLANIPVRVVPVEFAGFVIPPPGPAVIQITSAQADYTPNIAWTVLGLVTLGAATLTGIGLLRLGSAAQSLRRLRNASRPVDSEASLTLLRTLSRKLGISRDVDLRHAPGLESPVSFGVLRPTILVDDPAGDNLNLMLQHELLHHRRGDILRTWAAEVVRSLFFIHPVVHVLRQRLDELVEMDCDAWVLSETDVSRTDYASLLMNYVLGKRNPGISMPLGTPKSQIKTRIDAMKSPIVALKSHPVGTLIGVFVFGIISTFAACTDSFVGPEDGPGGGAAETEQPADSTDVFVIAEEMPVLIGGLEGIQANIQYPDIARRAGVEGRVYLQFVVDTEGVPRDIVVVRGIGAGADEEAKRLVEEARFKPGRQAGKPVPVKMSLPVTFRLDDPPPPPSTGNATSPSGSGDRPPPSPPQSASDIKVFDSLGEVPYDYVVVGAIKRGQNGRSLQENSAEDFPAFNDATAVVRGGPDNRGILGGDAGALAEDADAYIFVRKSE